jgi:hypothetical protein
MVLASTVLLLAFVVLSAIDGVYLHLWRYRLWARADSRYEHWLHTGRAVLFAPIVLLVFAAPTAGAALWAGVALLAIDQVLEVLDVLEERASREGLGGLSSGEYLVHAILVTLRAGAIALALAARPEVGWRLEAPLTIGTYTPTITFLVQQLVPGAIVIALVHVWLGVRRVAAIEATARA